MKISHWQDNGQVQAHERAGKPVKGYTRRKVLRWKLTVADFFIVSPLAILLVWGYGLQVAPLRPAIDAFPTSSVGTCMKLQDYPQAIKIKGAALAEVKAFCNQLGVTIK